MTSAHDNDIDYDAAKFIASNAADGIRDLKSWGWRSLAIYTAAVVAAVTNEQLKASLLTEVLMFFGSIFILCHIYMQHSRLGKYRLRLNKFYDEDKFVSRFVANCLDPDIKGRSQYKTEDVVIYLLQLAYVDSLYLGFSCWR